MGDFVVRIPLLENLGGQYGDLFAHSRRRLTQPEKAIAQPIFQSSVDLDEVQIVETGVINAPTTLGNHIRVSPGYSMDDATLIHELTHIWQFQTQGNGYISNSLYHQAVATLCDGTRNAAYNVTIVPGQSFYRYAAEHQAVIVETYFADKSKRRDPDYIRMIREVRRARPTVSQMDRYQESLYGPRNRLQDQLDDMHRSDRVPMDSIAPIFRFEW